MSKALEEARRIAGGVAQQRRNPDVRRAALLRLHIGDLVQVVDAAGKPSPPTILWQAKDGPACVIADFARCATAEDGSGWQYHERVFSADGADASGSGRVLVVPEVSQQQARQIREAQLARWATALDARERAFDAALPPEWQEAFKGEWLSKALAEDPQEVERRAAQQILEATEARP